MRDMPIRAIAALALTCLTGGCSPEQRTLVSPQPTSPPVGPSDPRIAAIEGNFQEIAQGGRYFGWYGCAACHDAVGGNWPPPLRFDLVYAAIGHRGFDRRIPGEQRWQIAAYLHSLPATDAARRHRQAVDQRGEPAASFWRGPL